MLPPQCPTDAESLTAVSGRLLCFACCLGGERAAPLALPLSCSHNSVFKNREERKGREASPDYLKRRAPGVISLRRNYVRPGKIIMEVIDGQ